MCSCNLKIKLPSSAHIYLSPPLVGQHYQLWLTYSSYLPSVSSWLNTEQTHQCYLKTVSLFPFPSPWWHHTPSSWAPLSVSQCAALLPLPQAVGLGLDYVKLGGLSSAERITKYNRLSSIEEELAQQGILGRFLCTPPLSFFFLARQRKRRPDKANKRGVVMPGLENTSRPVSLCWIWKENVCEESYKCVFVYLSGRMKTPPLDLLISHLITHSDKYFPIHSFLKQAVTVQEWWEIRVCVRV